MQWIAITRITTSKGNTQVLQGNNDRLQPHKVQDFKKIVSAENEGRELKTDDNRKGCGKICLIRNGREKGRFHS